MSAREDVWVVVPLFNEAAVVADVLAPLMTLFPHVLCVDDGSSDSSGAAALAAGAHVATHPINLGQGAALQTGFDWVLASTSARYVVTFDSDGQHRPEDAADLVDLAEREGAAFVLGSRFLDGAPREMSRLRRLVLRAAACVSRLRTGLKLTDAHNGLRVIRRDALTRVRLTHNRMAHATQIVEQLAATGLAWREAPVHVRYTDYSRAKGQSLLNSVNILVELVMGGR
ncbi:glycosyltransferase family 2 protein [Actinomyces sp. B33]|uniref:glycosyltransferase family 2 protein n=1 Tax=Actinomyces sp. B33 TaxID=2942131 RepID=UPI0023400CAC|nr:glycosyltransferase family 2 protein [Actinomyces sp. B33]MDC4232630.1 glycosyltransferase family 2 protein [Actinomyces sp. B33]